MPRHGQEASFRWKGPHGQAKGRDTTRACVDAVAAESRCGSGEEWGPGLRRESGRGWASQALRVRSGFECIFCAAGSALTVVRNND